jgi:hypothetical protein
MPKDMTSDNLKQKINSSVGVYSSTIGKSWSSLAMKDDTLKQKIYSSVGVYSSTIGKSWSFLAMFLSKFFIQKQISKGLPFFL